MKKEHHLPSLIDFWRIKRKAQGLPCIIKPFHHDLANAYTKLLLGLLPRPNMMVLEPPRCLKTSLCDTFIEYALSYFPDSEFIKSGFGKELPVESVVAIRNTLSSDWYRSITDDEWGCHVEMVGEKAAGRQDHFYTLEGGSVKAGGVGTGIIGFGAGKLRPEFGGAIVMDDLLKPQDMRSAVVRKSTWDYIQNGLKPRRNRQSPPYTPLILIMQRLHPEDPAGMCLREERDDWYVVCVPAHNPDGTSIWEERISAAELEKMRVRDPEKYHSQYQQNPKAGAGVILQGQWWYHWQDRLDMERRFTLKFITADTAFKAQDANDWSVFQCWGCEGKQGLHLVDQIRGKWEFPELLKYAKAFWLKHRVHQRGYTPATHFFIEDKASGISLIQSMQRQGIPVIPWAPADNTSPDKVGRAKQASDPLASGRISLPPLDARQDLKWRDLPPAFKKEYPRQDTFEDLPDIKWVQCLKDEAESFSTDDSHLFDDQVDTFTEAACIWMENGGGVGSLPNMGGLIQISG